MKKFKLILSSMVLALTLTFILPPIAKADADGPGGPQDTSKASKAPEIPLDPAIIFALLRVIVIKC